jgi:hypothetical protein
MRSLEARWNCHKLQDDTFAGRPTKLKMPKDYAKDVRAEVRQGLLGPENDFGRLPTTVCLCLWHNIGLPWQPGL